VPEYYREPKLSQIEHTLETYLRNAYSALSEHLTLLEVSPDENAQELRTRVAAIPIDAAQRFHEGLKFCRLMKGRLLFYAEDIPWFETEWLIENELGRIVRYFVEEPLRAYALVRFGEKLDPENVLNRIQGDILSIDDVEGVRDFARTASRPVLNGEHKTRAREAALMMNSVLCMAETIGHDMYARLSQGRSHRKQ
jgi:hypothetical protein